MNMYYPRQAGKSFFQHYIMSTDVLKEWKENRFVVYEDHADNDLRIILTDFSYWVEHIHELREWCVQHQLPVEGLSVKIPSDKMLMWFKLRWS